MDGGSTNAWISEDGGASWLPTPVPWTARAGSGITTIVGVPCIFGGMHQTGPASGDIYDEYWFSGGFDRGDLEWRGPMGPWPDPKRYPWPPARYNHGFLSANPNDSRQWLLGGRGRDSLLNDVWDSWNIGCSWTRHTANAAWSPREALAFCGAPRSFDPKTSVPLGQLWVFGGGNEFGPVTDTAYTSLDGATWIPVKGPWEGRDQAYAAVLGDSIYVLGGTAGDDAYPELWVADLVVNPNLPAEFRGDPVGWWFEAPEWTRVDADIPCGSGNFIATVFGGDLYINGSANTNHLYRMSPLPAQPQ